MAVKVDHVSPTKVTLEIEVEVEKVKGQLDQAIVRATRAVQVPGFRKGKAPRRLAEKYVNRQQLYHDLLDRLMTEAYLAALQAEHLEPVSPPSVEVVRFEEDTPFIFKATFERRPEIALGDYTSIEVSIPRQEFREEDVETTLKSLQEQRATYVPVEERPLAKGDFAIIDFTGTVDGAPMDGGSATARFVEVVDDAAIPGFMQAIAGMVKGEERTVNVKLPDDFSPEYGGKDAQFEVRLSEIKEKRLPELSDEFAKQLGPYESLDQVREEIRAQIKGSLQQREQAAIADQAVRKVVEGVTVELPLALVTAKTESLTRNLEQHLGQRGSTLDDYCQSRQITPEALRQEIADEAARQVKVDLVLDEIARVEKIQVGEEDIDVELERFVRSSQQGTSKEQLRDALARQGTIGNLRASIAKQKAIGLLISRVKVAPVGESETKGGHDVTDA